MQQRAASKIVSYSFGELRFKRLVASMDVDNVASRKVSERLGFELKMEKEIDGKRIAFYELTSV